MLKQCKTLRNTAKLLDTLFADKLTREHDDSARAEENRVELTSDELRQLLMKLMNIASVALDDLYDMID